MDLPDDSRQWDYTDAAQRILIAERCRAMLDALASNTPNVLAGETGHAASQIVFSMFSNARTDVDIAIREMRNPTRDFARGIYTGEQPASTATALHSCSACGRHPDTHKRAEDDNCAMCGMGEEK